jgi:class 3 adenylate cyclase
MLFADIKGSMDLIEDLDPEEAQAIVDPALKLMMEAVQHYGGYVAQPTGDGIFALSSSRCSALRSRMKTIRSARYSPHSECRRS